MYRFLKTIVSKLNHKESRSVALFGILLFALLLTAIFTATPAGAAETSMKHSTPDYYVSEHRMQLDVDVRDPGGINLVRCYFKAAGEADLVFVPMSPAGSNKYAGIVPAPSATTDQIEYLFLAVNAANQVVRSQTFYIYKDDAQKKPAWQDIPKDGEIRVSMELDKAPAELRGFSDNVAIDVVESGVRFGVVALLYDASQSGSGAGLSGSAASATSAGTVSAEAAGFSTTTMIVAGVVGAAAVGGGIAAASSSSGSGGKSAGEELTTTTILGNWKFSGNRRDTVRRTGTINFNENGTHTYTVKDADGQSDGSGSGNWSLSENMLTITFQTISTWNGTVSGDSKKFALSNTGHGDYTFTR